MARIKAELEDAPDRRMARIKAELEDAPEPVAASISKRTRSTGQQMTLRGEPAGHMWRESRECHLEYMGVPRPEDDNDPVQVTLPDGSIVPLWRYSQMDQPKHFQQLWRNLDILREFYDFCTMVMEMNEINAANRLVWDPMNDPKAFADLDAEASH